jgi:predicted enzyme related to lactoylglutathione lyase
MKVEKVTYLLMAQDMQRALAFYQNVFGMEANQISPFWSEVTLGGAVLGLHGGGDGSRNTTDLSLQVDNIVAACKIIRQHGGRIMSEPAKRLDEPIVLAVFQDTEGNEVMLTQLVTG